MGCTAGWGAGACSSCTARSSGSRAWMPATRSPPTRCPSRRRTPRASRPVARAAARPDVVWFGEMLRERVTAEAWDLAAACQAMLVVGTSGLVQPAAQLPYIARDTGATVIEVNPDPTEVSAAAHIVCSGPAGAMLPALVAALTEGEST